VNIYNIRDIYLRFPTIGVKKEYRKESIEYREGSDESRDGNFEIREYDIGRSTIFVIIILNERRYGQREIASQ